MKSMKRVLGLILHIAYFGDSTSAIKPSNMDVLYNQAPYY